MRNNKRIQYSAPNTLSYNILMFNNGSMKKGELGSYSEIDGCFILKRSRTKITPVSGTIVF